MNILMLSFLSSATASEITFRKEVIIDKIIVQGFKTGGNLVAGDKVLLDIVFDQVTVSDFANRQTFSGSTINLSNIIRYRNSGANMNQGIYDKLNQKVKKLLFDFTSVGTSLNLEALIYYKIIDS